MGIETSADIQKKILKEMESKYGSNSVPKEKKNQMGKDDFLKIMVTQLKNQDPISPLKNEELAVQLAQFSSLEQLLNMNKNMEKFVESFTPSQKFQASNLLGKMVAVDSSKVSHQKGKPTEISFDLPEGSPSVTVEVLNPQGEVIKKITKPDAGQGRQSVDWNGLMENGSDAPNGVYSFRVKADNVNGKPLTIKTDTMGTVTGIEFEGKEIVLKVNGQKVLMKDVTKIEIDEPKTSNQPGKPVSPNQLNGVVAPTGQAVPSGQDANAQVPPELMKMLQAQGAPIPSVQQQSSQSSKKAEVKKEAKPEVDLQIPVERGKVVGGGKS